MTRTHLLTGAGSGIGAALAQRLNDRGDRLVLLVRTQERAREVEAQWGERHRVEVVDLADGAAVTAVGKTLSQELGAIDSVVHCAGVVELARVDELDASSWRQQLDVNLTAPALLTGAVLPALRTSRGTVVFVNSTAGIIANANWSAYAASKHALRALADALRAEEAEHGLRVTSVFPSRTASAMQAKVRAQEGKDYHPEDWMSADSVAASLVHVLDLPCDSTITELTIRTSPSPS